MRFNLDNTEGLILIGGVVCSIIAAMFARGSERQNDSLQMKGALAFPRFDVWMAVAFIVWIIYRNFIK